ncbi:exo-alpha-sialidase [Paenibacillus thalictri]|nr:exo-alpha-sialidase [Paenibacillus thalictri]
MGSSITNNYPQGQITHLEVEQATIFQPGSDQDWTYSHHQHVVFYRGKLYAIWSNGRVNEDDTGQRVMMSTSADFHHWSAPLPLLDSQDGEYGEWVYTAAGFHVHGEKLIAYIGQYEYKPEHLSDGVRNSKTDAGHIRTGLLAMATEDGEHWSEPVDLGLRIVPNHGPQRTSSGRLIISGNISYPYTEDPEGLSGWRATGIYAAELESEMVDDSEYIHVLPPKMGWPTMLCEGSFYQTDDGRLNMLLRSKERRLWLTTSDDDGASWSAPEPTLFPDSNTKFHFGRLPDGRFYYVGSPVPDGRRNPLVLSVSSDGISFDRHTVLCDAPCERKFEGMHKGGDYGYPHSMIHDGWLYVIFSVTKEQVHIVRVPIAAV